MTGAALFPTASIPAGSVTLRHTGRRLSRMRFICSGWGRARSATGWFYSASLGHRIHRTAFAKIEKRAGSWHGDSTEVAKANECLQKGLAQFGLTLAQARERYGKREKARYRKWAETVAFFATDCSFLDIANLVDRSVAQVVHEIHDTWYEDYMLGCIDYIASVAYHGGILLKPITTEKEITGHIGDTILSWCEKGQKDDGGNEFRD